MATIYMNCPHCDDELKFKAVSDYQGEGVWGQSFTFAELEKQNCDCVITDAEMDELQKGADEKANEPVEDDYL